MIPGAFDFLTNRVLAYIIALGKPQIIGDQGDNARSPTDRQFQRESPFLRRVDEFVVKLFVDTANYFPQQICALLNRFFFGHGTLPVLWSTEFAAN
jgi:hypothetical protein